MIIYFNRRPVTGPWGGGSKILAACILAFQRAGHDVVHVLDQAVDVAFCFDPRPGIPCPGMGSLTDQVGYEPILAWARKNVAAGKRVFIVQRVGDIGTHGKPDLTNLVLASSLHSDTVVFPSIWAHDWIQHTLERHDVRPTKQWHVVPNAPLPLFQRAKRVRNSIPHSISFVTHHWSTNPSKGFAFYVELKRWCESNGHRFTYIGREPTPGELTSTPALNEYELSIELPKHDVYVTASLAEAGANHVLEAMACGLPVIYHQGGGSIAEYCMQTGVPFDGSIRGFTDAVENLRTIYPKVRRNLKKYRATVEDTAQQYVQIVEGLVCK